MTEATRLWLALSLLPGITCVRLEKLQRQYPDPAKLLEEPSGILAQLGLPLDLEARLPWKRAEQEHQQAEQAGIRILSCSEPDFPEAFQGLSGSAPVLLYWQGLLPKPQTRSVAIVGTRKATPAGLETARRLAFELASADITVVSGLARGIDTAAHRGALEAKGKTVAVLASGLLQVYPPENRELAGNIGRSGACISEYGLRVEPVLGGFLRRNRWIAALAEITILVEAPVDSGALKTAHHAREMGRRIMVAPGPMYSTSWSGSNRLLRDGAEVITQVEDVLHWLDSRMPSAAQQGELWPGPQQAIWQCLEMLPQTVEEIVNRSGMPAGEVRAGLIALELAGALRRHPGPMYGLP